MDAKKFSDAYSDKPYLPPNESEDHFKLMESSRVWSQRFGNVVLDVLANNDAATEGAIARLRSDYLSWGRFQLLPTYSALRGQQGDVSDGLNEINYHLLNIAMLPTWLHLAKNAEQMDHLPIGATQTTLATAGVQNVTERLSLFESGELFFKNNDRHVLTNKARSEFGATNEIDTAITLLEISKNNPSITILPSPDRFEHGRSYDKNIDFIVYDDQEHQARGVQAKTTANTHAMKTYDRDYVTLIDGDTDLDNQIAVKHAVGSKSKNGIMSWPGLISAHHLLQQKNIIKNLPRPNSSNLIDLTMVAQSMRTARWHARRASMSTKPSNKKAAMIVEARIMSDLYR